MARWWWRGRRRNCSRTRRPTTPARCSPPPSATRPPETARSRRNSEPLDCSNLASPGLDAGDRVVDVLECGRHVKGVGMHERVGVAHDRDMAFPEDEIAALQVPCLVRIERAAELGLLHVAVARAGSAGGLQRKLHQARAVDAEAALAAPKIGRADA